MTAGYNRDSVTLWKRVAGVETQIGTGTALKKRQKTVGDLRWHTLSSSYPLTVYHVHDNHWVFIDELCFIHESDSALSAGGAVGVYFPGLASHTTSVSNVQAQLLQSYWCASDGSDSATGARAAPFSTRNKLYATVGLNQIGIMRTRTFTGGTVVATQSSVTGTSHEEGPFLSNYAGETVTYKASGTTTEAIDTGGAARSYWRHHGLVFDGRVGATSTYGDNGVHGRSSAKGWTFSNCTFQDWDESGVLMTNNNGVGHHRFYDVNTARCGRLAGSQDHHIYCNGTDCEAWYLDMDGTSSFGYGWHPWSSGNNDSDRQKIRWSDGYNFTTRPAFLLAKGANQELVACKAYSNAQRAVSVGYSASGAIISWLLAYDNNIAVYIGEFTATTAKLYNATITENTYSIEVDSTSTSFTYDNNIIYNNTNNAVVDNGTSTTVGSNNLTSDPTFVSAASDDFHIDAGSAALNAGTDLSASIVSLDLDGQSVPQDSAFPIGCYDIAIPPENAPVVSLNATYAFNTNTPSTFTNIAVSDVDADLARVYVQTDVDCTVTFTASGAVTVSVSNP